MNRSIVHVTSARGAGDLLADGRPAGTALTAFATANRHTYRRVRLIACLALLATLAACGSSHTHRTAHYNPSRYYPPPGPTSDPWGPYIREASGRFGVPENWVRRVMRQESGGQEDVISWAGAMGLMQVMPETYDGLRARYNLGDDPFDPHNNILAGTAYLREMYDRFGSPGFLAAYNAGPEPAGPLSEQRHAAAGRDRELRRLDRATAGVGDANVRAPGGLCRRRQRQAAVYRPTPAGCDPDAAYDPARPCVPIRPAVVQVAAARRRLKSPPIATRTPPTTRRGAVRPHVCPGARRCGRRRMPPATATRMRI